MSLTILYIDWGQNSFLLIALLTLFQESMQGIILPILFINNLPNLKNYIWKKIFKTATAFKNGLSTICITVIGYLPKRENQIDVMAWKVVKILRPLKKELSNNIKTKLTKD